MDSEKLPTYRSLESNGVQIRLKGDYLCKLIYPLFNTPQNESVK